MKHLNIGTYTTYSQSGVQRTVAESIHAKATEERPALRKVYVSC